MGHSEKDTIAQVADTTQPQAMVPREGSQVASHAVVSTNPFHYKVDEVCDLFNALCDEKCIWVMKPSVKRKTIIHVLQPEVHVHTPRSKQELVREDAEETALADERRFQTHELCVGSIRQPNEVVL